MVEKAQEQARKPDVESSKSEGELLFRQPSSLDGMAVHNLIASNPPLDTNSVYCNLLQCSHFAPTCVVVELSGAVVAFMSAYVKPSEPDVLFIWQMVVSASARGRGVSGRMLSELLAREHLAETRYIETTISPGNAPSEAVFRRFAKDHGAAVENSILFSKEDHFDGQHDDEVLYRIGPFSIANFS